jgi:DNA processing protein
MQEEKLHQLALTLVPGIGDILIKNLISYTGSAEQVFKLPRHKLLKIPGIGGKAVAEIVKPAVLQEAETQLQQVIDKDIKLLFYTDKDYPGRLKQIYDSPALLYLNGNIDLNHYRMLAIVGTRNATAYGKSFVADIVQNLKGQDVVIVSGLAYGIDIAAHKAALHNDMPTVAVMGSGVDIIYPSLHKKYALQMPGKGGLISEYPLGTTPDPARFPARNRIIAGLTDATLVVEAAEKGGALITADLASGYDREVLALPGDITSPTSVGCNNLIKKNVAQMITSAEDLSFYLQWDTTGLPSATMPSVLAPEEFSKDEWAVISTLQANGLAMQIDELSWRSQTQISQLATILLNLEFKGTINSLPGKKYTLR